MDDAHLAACRMALDCHPSSPLRPPGWRWARAGILQSGPARADRRDDEGVRRALRLRKAMNRSGGTHTHPRVSKVDPLCLAAWHLHEGKECRRWELEARLLAGQDDLAIAARMDISEAVVMTYEAIFYDVRRRLACSDWITAFVFGPQLHGSMAPGNIELLWKVCGYHLGPLVLEALMGPPQATSGGWSAGADCDPTQGTVDRRAMVAAVLTLRVDERSGPLILRLAARLQEIESLTASWAAAPIFAPIAFGDLPCSGHATRFKAGSRDLPPGAFCVIADGDAADDPALPAYAPVQFPVPLVGFTAAWKATG